MSKDIEQYSITPHEGKMPNGTFSAKYPQQFFDALDRCVDLYDAFVIASELGRIVQPNLHKLAGDIRRYLQDKVPKRTLARWIQPLNKEWRENNKKKKIQELLDIEPVIEGAEWPKLFQGDFIEHSEKIENDSIDLIFTDPPYNRKSLSVYEDLGILAQQVLKPGGSLVTFIGSYELPQILEMLLRSGLKYWWLICVKHAGQHAHMFQRGVFVEWKPMLWFVKGDKLMKGLDSVEDFIQSTAPEKILHPWQQSTVEAEYIINKLTVGENQIILDPFMGSGTTGIAAVKLKRKFIGIEKDKEMFEIARREISK